VFQFSICSFRAIKSLIFQEELSEQFVKEKTD